MRKIIFILFCFLLSACAQNSAQNNQTVNVKPSPSPQPTVSDEQKAESKKAADEYYKAINNFIAQNYKGWTLRGTAGGEYSALCDDDKPCVLHLVNGSQNKIVTVMMRSFGQPDGTSYWFVYEARPIDLSRAKIDEIKESKEQAVLENLDREQCKSVCDD